MPTLTGRAANFLATRVSGVGNAFTRNHVSRYRRSNGRRGGKFLGKPVFLLDVVGRSTGEPRPVMLMLVRRGDDLLVCGSNGGNPETPNWYRNLMAADTTEVQVGAERWTVRPRELSDGDESDECWQLLIAGYPDFASYQELTDRQLPVAILERAAEAA